MRDEDAACFGSMGQEAGLPRLAVNFDPALVRMLREVRCFLAQRSLPLDIPAAALRVRPMPPAIEAISSSDACESGLVFQAVRLVQGFGNLPGGWLLLSTAHRKFAVVLKLSGLLRAHIGVCGVLIIALVNLKSAILHV